MKSQSSKIVLTVRRWVTIAVVMIIGLVSTMTGYSQEPGSNPDAPRPQDVPFNSKMSIALIVVGVVLAVIVLRRLQKNRKAAAEAAAKAEKE